MSLKSPMFSVIIPVYKDKDRLLLCLEGLKNQSFSKSDFEVIVVNNEPGYNFQISEFESFGLNLIILNEEIPGSYAARNKGVNEAKSELIAFTDSDCIPDLDWLKNAWDYFIKDLNEEIGIVTGIVPLFFKDNNRLTNAEVYEKYTGFNFEAYVKEGTCGAGNWFSYRKTLLEFGGFNSTLKSNGDTELSSRISKKYKIIFDPKIIVHHPARYKTKDIVYKYRRLIGGAYNRRFEKRKFKFLKYMINFSIKRIRFSLKKFFTVKISESIPIFIVSVKLLVGGWAEFFVLINGTETKR